MRLLAVSEESFNILCSALQDKIDTTTDVSRELPSYEADVLIEIKKSVQHEGRHFLLCAKADDHFELDVGVGYDSTLKTADRARDHRKMMSDQDRIYSLMITENGMIKTCKWDVDGSDWDTKEAQVSLLDKLKSKLDQFYASHPRMKDLALTLDIEEGVEGAQAHILKPGEEPSMVNAVSLSAKELQNVSFLQDPRHKLAYVMLRIEARREW